MRDAFWGAFGFASRSARPREARICCVVFVNTLARNVRRNICTKGKKGVKVVLESGLLKRCLSHLLYVLLPRRRLVQAGSQHDSHRWSQAPN